MRATILCPLVLFCLSLPAAADVTVASPDGRVRFVLSSGAQGHLEYTVTFNSKTSSTHPRWALWWMAWTSPAARRSARRRPTDQRNLPLVRPALHRHRQLQRRSRPGTTCASISPHF